MIEEGVYGKNKQILFLNYTIFIVLLSTRQGVRQAKFTGLRRDGPGKGRGGAAGMHAERPAPAAGICPAAGRASGPGKALFRKPGARLPKPSPQSNPVYLCSGSEEISILPATMSS